VDTFDQRRVLWKDLVHQKMRRTDELYEIASRTGTLTSKYSITIAELLTGLG